jgi:hypothetical protein
MRDLMKLAEKLLLLSLSLVALSGVTTAETLSTTLDGWKFSLDLPDGFYVDKDTKTYQTEEYAMEEAEYEELDCKNFDDCFDRDTFWFGVTQDSVFRHIEISPDNGGSYVNLAVVMIPKEYRDIANIQPVLEKATKADEIGMAIKNQDPREKDIELNDRAAHLVEYDCQYEPCSFGLVALRLNDTAVGIIDVAVDKEKLSRAWDIIETAKIEKA